MNYSSSHSFLPPLLNEEWKGQHSAKFTTSRKHVKPITPKEQPHPLYSINSRRHFDRKETPTYEWKPSIKTVSPQSHANDKIIGIKKIISHYTIVKPRVERVHFVEKSNSGSLADLLSGKMFLQKNRGVKARMMEETLRQKREEERMKRTWDYIQRQ